MWQSIFGPIFGPCAARDWDDDGVRSFGSDAQNLESSGDDSRDSVRQQAENIAAEIAEAHGQGSNNTGMSNGNNLNNDNNVHGGATSSGSETTPARNTNIPKLEMSSVKVLYNTGSNGQLEQPRSASSSGSRRVSPEKQGLVDIFADGADT